MNGPTIALVLFFGPSLVLAASVSVKYVSVIWPGAFRWPADPHGLEGYDG